jgi:hypothetical protein
LIGGLGLVIASASANAAPAAADLSRLQPSNIIQVADGCGFGWRANYWGDCVPNRFFRPRHHRPDYVIEEWDEYEY